MWILYENDVSSLALSHEFRYSSTKDYDHMAPKNENEMYRQQTHKKETSKKCNSVIYLYFYFGITGKKEFFSSSSLLFFRFANAIHVNHVKHCKKFTVQQQQEEVKRRKTCLTFNSR